MRCWKKLSLQDDFLGKALQSHGMAFYYIYQEAGSEVP
jgi:hypothetical protein